MRRRFIFYKYVIIYINTHTHTHTHIIIADYNILFEGNVMFLLKLLLLINKILFFFNKHQSLQCEYLFN